MSPLIAPPNLASETVPWYGALAQPAQEFARTPLPVLAGAVPPNLKGTLYRNGPARFERGGRRVNHWFDGDGAVLAVQFAEGQAWGTYRYVRTREFQEEETAQILLYGGYGSLPAIGVWNRLQRLIKNAANTSVLALEDQLLALWEGGLPYRLNLEDLSTVGISNLGGLQPEQTFSAHPKRDPKTGEIYNFGIGLGREGKLFLYRCSPQGQIIQQRTLPLPNIPLIHDMALVGPYLVFVIPPVILKKPLLILLGMGSYSDCLNWTPRLGTQILVVDRDRLEVVSQTTVDPWFQWHLGNGYLNDAGQIQLTIARYADFATNQFLKEVVQGKITTSAPASFWEVTLDPQAGTLVNQRQLINLDCDFPVVRAEQVGERSRYTYLALHPPGSPQPSLLQGLGRYDHDTETLTHTTMPPHHYPTEPIVVANPQVAEQDWVLSVVYDGDRHQSEVWIYAGNRLGDEPIGRLGLPTTIPIGFHGTWRSR
jgi:carotenoid cleavage dioxygenase-like enzyme